MNQLDTYYAYKDAYLEQDGTNVEIDAVILRIEDWLEEEREVGSLIEELVVLCDEEGIEVEE